MFNPFFYKTERMRQLPIAITGAASLGWVLVLVLVLLLGPPLLGVSLLHRALVFLVDWMTGTKRS
ncbi:hypothetical protein [Lysobacter rhizosphaerae]